MHTGSGVRSLGSNSVDWLFVTISKQQTWEPDTGWGLVHGVALADNQGPCNEQWRQPMTALIDESHGGMWASHTTCTCAAILLAPVGASRAGGLLRSSGTTRPAFLSEGGGSY